MKSLKTALILPIAWLILSTFLLTIPGSSFPKENWLDRLWVDKWVHIFMFAIMTWLWCRTYRGSAIDPKGLKNIFLTWAIVVFAYGIGMEFVQKYLVANRGFDVWDIAADGVGAAIGYVYSVRRYIKK